LLKYALLFLTASVLLAGCTDRISTLGAQFYTDTVGIHTLIRNDPGFMQFADTTRPFVSVNGGNIALTDSTTIMLIGRVASSNENLESWGLLQFLELPDSTDSMITSVRLLLKDEPYKYGDTTSNNVNFRVWTCFKKVYDSTTSLSMSDLSSSAVGSIDTLFPDDTADRTLAIPLDLSVVRPLLTDFNNAFVITPAQGAMTPMTNVRGFGTIHNYSDANSFPQLQLILSNGDTIYRTPTLDFHLVKDNSLTPANEFTLRGSAGVRERVTLNLTRPTDTANLDEFTSINNATLMLHLDPANTAHSNRPGDTIGPWVVRLGAVDSADQYDVNGYRDPSDPTGTTYRFQARAMVEYWLHNPSKNYGFELRSGFDLRSLGGKSIGVEDYTLNRWTFYGPNCSDTSKRPYFILSYSKLR
jgi:hypothetical protein